MARPKSFMKRESSRFLKEGVAKPPPPKTDALLVQDAAVLEKTTMESLRNSQFKDRDGNIIGKS